jgi:hypothetical protein
MVHLACVQRKSTARESAHADLPRPHSASMLPWVLHSTDTSPTATVAVVVAVAETPPITPTFMAIANVALEREWPVLVLFCYFTRAYCQDLSGLVRRCQEVSGGVRRCQEVSGGVRRCQEVSGGVRKVAEGDQPPHESLEVDGVTDIGLRADEHCPLAAAHAGSSFACLEAR